MFAQSMEEKLQRLVFLTGSCSLCEMIITVHPWTCFVLSQDLIRRTDMFLHLSKVLSSTYGPTISFNLKREDGSWFGFREVEKLASLSGIHLRVSKNNLVNTWVHQKIR